MRIKLFQYCMMMCPFLTQYGGNGTNHTRSLLTSPETRPAEEAVPLLIQCLKFGMFCIRKTEE
jgi:hypothetical protein